MPADIVVYYINYNLPYATKFFFEITCTVQIKLKDLIHCTSLKLATTLEPGSFNNLL